MKSEKELALELLDVAGYYDNCEKLVDQQIGYIRSAFDMSDENVQELSVLVKKVLARDDVINGVADMYVNLFSLVELNDIVEFYKSPTGSKWMGLIPDITNRTHAILETAFTEVMGELSVE